jgi:Memo-like protein
MPARLHRQLRAVSQVSSSTSVRPAAVAGSFYPCNADELTTAVDTLLGQAWLQASEDAALLAQVAPVALVAQHAGYIYSAPWQRPPTDACVTSRCAASQC